MPLLCTHTILQSYNNVAHARKEGAAYKKEKGAASPFKKENGHFTMEGRIGSLTSRTPLPYRNENENHHQGLGLEGG